jgi:hypothetical protein
MPSLIVLPESAPVAEEPLAGKVLMLNTAVRPRFQCYGFCVTRNSPIQIVPAFAMEAPLRKALADKILLDVTGTDAAAGSHAKIIADIDKAVKAQTMSVVTEGEEIGPRVLMGTDEKGNSYVITPKDDEDYQRMLEEIQVTGKLRIPKPKAKEAAAATTGLTAIYEEDLPDTPSPGE